MPKRSVHSAFAPRATARSTTASASSVISVMFAAIDAVVPFHPGVTKASEVKRLKVPVQIHHGTADQAVALAESQRLMKELKSQRTPVELFTYEGAGHGFLAYTRPTYNAEAAKLAWRRAVQFLHKYLGS